MTKNEAYKVFEKANATAKELAEAKLTLENLGLEVPFSSLNVQTIEEAEESLAPFDQLVEERKEIENNTSNEEE